MLRIIIIGGHGKIALLAERMLVAQGHAVTAVIRNPEHAEDVRATGATPLVADVEHLDTDALARLIADHDAVVWSAGAGGGDPARTYAVDRDAANRTIDAAQRVAAKRYIMVSYFGSSPDHGVDPESTFWHYAEAKAAADAYLRASDLDWTVLGPSALTLDPPTAGIDAQAETSGSVSRETVAQVIVAALADDSTIGRTIRFNDGETPIAQALRS